MIAMRGLEVLGANEHFVPAHLRIPREVMFCYIEMDKKGLRCQVQVNIL